MASRPRAWADQRFNAETLNVTGNILADLLENAPTMDTLTAVRIIGDIMVEYDPMSTHSDQLNVIDVGVGVTSVEAFAVGIMGVPQPHNETEYPPRGWLYVATQSVMNSITTGAEAAVMRAARFQFDLRAMRRVDKGILFLAIQSSAGKGTGITTLVTGRVRTLCLT